MIDLKVLKRELDDKPVAVFGLGLSGLATVRALTAAGIGVAAWDDNPQSCEEAKKAGATIQNLLDANLSSHAFLVLSPGIPYAVKPHPVVTKARDAGIDIIGDIELFHRAHPDAVTVGVTGTNGKSTTTALIGHILTHAGLPAQIGGNIGRAVLDLETPPENSIVVLELSSYQLDLCKTFSPTHAVHLNLTLDHIDRHGTLQSYADAKMRIFRGPGKAIIGVDDANSLSMFGKVHKAGGRDLYAVSVTQKVTRGVYVENNTLFDALGSEAAEAGNLAGCKTLNGLHNHQNAAAAYAVCALMGVKPETILAAMATYPGLPHRMFLTRVINGVAYINDSKATNADAAGKALGCYRNIYWILGGKAKEGGLNGLEPYTGNIRQAYVIGEASEDFATWLHNHGVAVNRCETLDRAVTEAHRMAQSERGQPGGTGVVLLSPACASFDQFKSYEHRGDAFTGLVQNLSDTQEIAAE